MTSGAQAAPTIEQHIKRIVATAPPISAAQRERITALFKVGGR